MKKLFILLCLVAATGVMFAQNIVEVSYTTSDDEMHLCVTDSINLGTIMQGEWSGPGVENNVFYTKGIPAGEVVKLSCGKKEFLIYIQGIPYISLGWVPKEVKVGSQPIQLSGYPAGGTWSLNGVPFDGNFSAKEVGVYEVVYMLTDKYGCTSGAADKINVK